MKSSANGSTHFSKKRRISTKVASLGVSLVLLLVFGGMSIISSRRHQATDETLFCAGRDRATGEYHRVVTRGGDSKQGGVRVLTRLKPPSDKDSEQNWESKYEDKKGWREFSARDGSQNVTMKVDDHHHVQVFRVCGPAPKCEIQKFALPSSSVMQEEQDNIHRAERLAYQYRQATAEVAHKFGMARKKAIELREKIQRLEQAPPSTRMPRSTESAKRIAEKQELENEFREASMKANELAEKLATMSASTREVHRKGDLVRSMASINKVQIETTDLEVYKAEDWCPSSP